MSQLTLYYDVYNCHYDQIRNSNILFIIIIHIYF